MKYKVLLTGNNKMIINEFFTYMDFSFECLTTSDRYDDIVNHVKYIHPDVLVYCLYGENPDDMKRFVNVLSVTVTERFCGLSSDRPSFKSLTMDASRFCAEIGLWKMFISIIGAIRSNCTHSSSSPTTTIGTL